MDLCSLNSGYAIQQIYLDCSGEYLLSFSGLAIEGFTEKSRTSVKWNNETVLLYQKAMPGNEDISVTVDGREGKNVLEFRAISEHLSGYGLHIDDVRL